MSKIGSRDRVSSSSCVLGGSGAVSLSTLRTIRSSDASFSVFSRLRAFSALPRSRNRPTTVTAELVESVMLHPFPSVVRCHPSRLLIGSMEVFVSSLRALDFVCPLKQAPGRAYSERNAYDCAKRDLERARIKQHLKGIAHTHSTTFRIGADSAHSFLDGLEDAFRSK